jgi:hypothetical protein
MYYEICNTIYKLNNVIHYCWFKAMLIEYYV